MIINKDTLRISGFTAVIAVFLLFALSVIYYSTLKGEINETIQSYGLIAILISSFILEFIPQFISPHLLILAGSFAEINIILLLFVIMISSTFGSVFGFIIGRKYGMIFVQQAFDSFTIKKIIKEINKRGRWFVFLSAISPLPYFPIIFGSLNLSGKNFLLYGVVPRLLSFIVLAFFSYYFIY